MKKKLITIITTITLLFAGCTTIPSPTVYESNSPEPISTPTPQPHLQTEVLPASVTPQATESPTPEPTVIYKGAVEHIFFHPLVAYPELAFDGDSMAQGYNDWFITVPEFKEIISQLYKNNYILIDIHSLYEENSSLGGNEIKSKDLMLPEGKKPLILSIDDLNYYDYMIDNGNVSKLVTNPAGDVITESIDPQGNKAAFNDNEIVPILDSFVHEHPDFSDHGAKGVIALTGYQGILGYRTNDEHVEIAKAEQVEASAVIQRLKETGWSFASHGWGHLDAVKVSFERFVKDTERWKREVEPLIGPTSIYIYPYGSRVETDSAKFNALKKLGFTVLCSVGPKPYLTLQSGVLMMDRRHIDGVALMTQRTKLLELFDAHDVMDPIRASK
ncbi:hypothetical protein EHS13_16670 [Paenibacillus psychroresistens]|uniref:NodB homology domain-containing protein n=1 Tax=Paenibacillus psychroresistens TaxID=1778678 RepID=A0A6B8RJG5_9BACL|nr:polysaccharide deacetylase family protein [Paenibacillus psychroresistens]QGQ96400.1 hypothetical protein EHS13_16670 [Paenibacillus psychroresistens]